MAGFHAHSHPHHHHTSPGGGEVLIAALLLTPAFTIIEAATLQPEITGSEPLAFHPSHE